MHVSVEMRQILADRVIRVRELADGRTVIDRLAGRHALQYAAPELCRNGIPYRYDALLALAGAAGFTLETI